MIVIVSVFVRKRQFCKLTALIFFITFHSYTQTSTSQNHFTPWRWWL